MPDNVTPEICRQFRTACHESQAKIQGLIEEAIVQSAALSDLKTEMSEKHTETIMTLMGSRINGLEDIIVPDLHKKINQLWTTVLIGALCGVIGIILPYRDISSDVRALQEQTAVLAKPLMHEEARQEFARIKLEIASCRRHVAQSDILIRKYDKADEDTHGRDLIMDKRLDKIESTINKYKHQHLNVLGEPNTGE